jgi:hypothetical protein
MRHGLDIGFIYHLYTLLGTRLYRLLTHMDYCPQSVTVSTSRFLAMGLNTGTVTASLNYTLQISHIESSFHSRTLETNSFLHSLPYRTLLNCLCPRLVVISHQPSSLPFTGWLSTELFHSVWGPSYIASGRTQQKTHSLVMGGYLAIARMLLTCLPAVTKGGTLLLAIIA